MPRFSARPRGRAVPQQPAPARPSAAQAAAQLRGSDPGLRPVDARRRGGRLPWLADPVRDVEQATGRERLHGPGVRIRQAAVAAEEGHAGAQPARGEGPRTQVAARPNVQPQLVCDERDR